MNRKNATRNALFTSILSLLLCVSMLVGTSFAWFTDSVTSGRNTITAGRLDIELYNDTKIDDSAKVDGNTKLFDGVNLWEPGVVVWENLTVANVGNLALKYTLELNVLEQTTTTVGETTYKLSDAIKVGVVANGITATDRSGVISAVTEWKTLTGFELGMDDEKLTAGATETFGIVLYWQPGDNDNIFNLNNDRLDDDALKLEIGVNLTATQVEEESDSFDDQYDVNAGKAETETEPTEPAETPVQRLQAALNAGGEVELNEDITLAAGESLSITRDVTLNLNGKTITAAGDALVVTSGATLTLNGDGEVKAGTSGVGSANAVWANGGNVIINGGTYSVGGDSKVAEEYPTHQNDVIYTKNGGTAVINGGTFLNDGKVWTLNQKDAGNEAGGLITVKGGTFQNWNPADNAAEGEGTNFVVEGYEATAETMDGDTWYTVVEDTNPEPVTVTASVDEDTFVTSDGNNNNKNADYSKEEVLSVRTGGTSGNVYYRTYFRVDFSEVIVTEGFNKDNAKVTFIFTIVEGNADNTGFAMKAFADVTDLDFTNLNWTEVKDGIYADELGWSTVEKIDADIAVNGDKITITVDYSDIENKAIFALTSDFSDLKIASTETTIAGAAPVVSVTYTPAAE